MTPSPFEGLSDTVSNFASGITMDNLMKVIGPWFFGVLLVGGLIIIVYCIKGLKQHD